MINICIPSLNRPELLKQTTLKLLIDLPTDDFKIYIFLSEADSRYDGLGTIVVTNIKGIGKTRTFIRNYFSVGEKIIQLDDDLKSIKSKRDNFNLINFFYEAFETMGKEDVKFCGCSPYSNEFFMNTIYTTNLKYTGGHLIFEIIRENPINVVIDHFEDYLANILYFIKDKKLLRFNDVYVETKYYNQEGGIVESYGSLKKRKEAAEQLSTKIEEYFPTLATAYKKKKFDVVNIRLKYRSKWTEDLIQLENNYNENFNT
tara:strand:- start:4282 stop:5058 length:777 start_codon:yes stop_codon:yes gene_type:complete